MGDELSYFLKWGAEESREGIHRTFGKRSIMDCKTEDQQGREQEDLRGYKDNYWGRYILNELF